MVDVREDHVYVHTLDQAVVVPTVQTDHLKLDVVSF